MKSLNPFEVNRQKHIDEMLNTTLIGYTNRHGDTATFDDVVWVYNYPYGTSINLFFYDNTKPPVKSVRIKGIKEQWRLNDSKRHLLMAYAIHLIALNVTRRTKTMRLAGARHLLSETVDDIHEITQSGLDNIVDSISGDKARKVGLFITWMKDKEFVSPHVKIKSIKDKNDNYDKLDELIIKMPEDKALMALGAICHDVILPDESKWETGSLASQRDAFVCAMSTLAMSSPNRVAAEQITLSNQYIKTEKIDSGHVIHWLDWQGSKGYKDNQNHLVANMIEPLMRCLKYIRQVTEPARVLARFYENPSAPLKSILGEFKPKQSQMKKACACLNKPTHLIQLGYLLDFYDEEATFFVPKGTPNATQSHGSQYMRKKVYRLSTTDQFLLAENTTSKSVLGAGLTKATLKDIFGKCLEKNLITVGDVQECWVKHLKRSIPTFPFTFVTDDIKVSFSSMMFAFTGHQIALSSSGSMGLRSFYHLTQGSQLSGLFSVKLSGRSRVTYSTTSIFEEHGFSSDFKITPHQFRHWLNDTGERAGVSHKMLNLWSGRQTPEQILHYVHSTEGERAHVVSDILFVDEKIDEDNIGPIRVYSQSEYERLSGIGSGISTASSTGFCIQNLLTEPCGFMNDFETQCTLCSSACHVKGDNEALDLLRKDLKFQSYRLTHIAEMPNFSQSKNMHNWYKVHSRNCEFLKELVALMEDPNIKNGSVIRVIESKGEIRITDLKLKLVDKRKLSLPTNKSAFEKIMDGIASNQNDEDPFGNLLSLIT